MKFLVVGIKINNFYKNISIAQNQRFLETFLIFISKQTIYLSIPTYIFPYSKSKYFFEFSIHSCRLKIRQNIFTKKMCIVVYTQQKQYKKDDQQIIGTSHRSHIYTQIFLTGDLQKNLGVSYRPILHSSSTVSIYSYTIPRNFHLGFFL